MDATAFFYDHAGWSYDPATETPEQGRQRCAARLADAEAWAADNGVVAQWWPDDDEPGAYGCIAGRWEDAPWGAVEHEASLWGVTFAEGQDYSTADYARVIEAELYAEIRSDREAAA